MYIEQYEESRITNSSTFYRKMRLKRILYKVVGELYVGRRIKMAYFRRWLHRLPVNSMSQIVEVGSGDGVFAFWLAKKFKHVAILGLELNKIEAQVCQQLAKREHLSNLRFQSTNLVSVSETGQADFVYCLDVLEHILDDTAAIKSIFALLNPGGHLLIHVPNRFFMETDGKLITIPDEEAWKINLGHVRQGYTPDELCSKLQLGGFHIRSILETQGNPATYAFRLAAKVKKLLPLRVLVLPFIDFFAWLDRVNPPTHGNTIWAWAQKPDLSD